LFEEALARWNADNDEKQFELESADTFDLATAKLNRMRLDGALLDLRLPGGDGQYPGGKLASLCVENYGIPAAIISGHPADFDKSKFNGMLEVFDKGDDDAYDKAIAWFGKLSRMMHVLEGTRNTIQKSGAAVFARRVWPRWSAYEKLSGINQAQLVGIVSRQYASHIADSLGIDSDENVKWHPFENYIVPALLESRPHTGDLFRMNGALWIVLTPQCDMATQKAITVLLARCDPNPALETWKDQLRSLRDASGNKQKSSIEFFKRLINQTEPARHFLPPLEGDQPLMVDFKNLLTVPMEELNNRLYDRIASVATPFLGNLTQRFGSYISRIGQPNLDTSQFV